MKYYQNTVLTKFYKDGYHDDIIISDGVTIKAIYKSIARNESNNMRPLFSKFPEIKPERIYGLQIDPAGFISVVRDRYILESIMFGEWEEVKR